MRSRQEILSRYKFVLAEEIERRVAEASRRSPHLCVHYQAHNLDTRREVHGEPNPLYNRITDADGALVPEALGLCLYGAEDEVNWSGKLCSEVADAQTCPFFGPRVMKEDIEKDITDLTSNPEKLRAVLPEAYALVWVIGAIETLPQLSWWQRLWWRWRKVQVEPLRLSAKSTAEESHE